jgi:hypothetical protein
VGEIAQAVEAGALMTYENAWQDAPTRPLCRPNLRGEKPAVLPVVQPRGSIDAKSPNIFVSLSTRCRPKPNDHSPARSCETFGHTRYRIVTGIPFLSARRIVSSVPPLRSGATKANTSSAASVR